jgi:hypothetical protein
MYLNNRKVYLNCEERNVHSLDGNFDFTIVAKVYHPDNQIQEFETIQNLRPKDTCVFIGKLNDIDKHRYCYTLSIDNIEYHNIKNKSMFNTKTVDIPASFCFIEDDILCMKMEHYIECNGLSDSSLFQMLFFR